MTSWESYIVYIYVAVNLDTLDREVSQMVGSAWADSTLNTRNSQWKRFIGFCADNDLIPLPASHHTVARFLVFQARSSKYSTVNNYLSAIVKLHQFYGHDADFRGSFLIKLVLAGIKRQLGDFTKQKIPLSPQQMMNIYVKLDLSNTAVRIMWCALIFSFRTLLRKSNFVPDRDGSCTHLVRRKDVVFKEDGATVYVYSTKTLKYQDRFLEIPLSFVDNPAFCVVSMLKEHFQTAPADKDSPLFLVPKGRGWSALLYRDLLTFIKEIVPLVGLDPDDVGLHSMRRSGTAYLHYLRVPLEDIKCIGDWRSLAVLMYLITPLDRKISIERDVVHSLSQLM